MLMVVRIELAGSDMALFEAYEHHVLALLPRHGARLVERLRAKDGSSEIHLLQFPDAAALDAFRADPARTAVQDMWRACGASATITEVERWDDRTGGLRFFSQA
ncbi:hypothetical protein ACFQGS_19685 [Novosphingobium lubricantis]